MKKIGLVCSQRPESTTDYYRGIINAFKPNYDTFGFLEMAVESVDLRLVGLFEEQGKTVL